MPAIVIVCISDWHCWMRSLTHYRHCPHFWLTISWYTHSQGGINILAENPDCEYYTHLYIRWALKRAIRNLPRHYGDLCVSYLYLICVALASFAVLAQPAVAQGTTTTLPLTYPGQVLQADGSQTCPSVRINILLCVQWTCLPYDTWYEADILVLLHKLASILGEKVWQGHVGVMYVSTND